MYKLRRLAGVNSQSLRGKGVFSKGALGVFCRWEKTVDLWPGRTWSKSGCPGRQEETGVVIFWDIKTGDIIKKKNDLVGDISLFLFAQ